MADRKGMFELVLIWAFIATAIVSCETGEGDEGNYCLEGDCSDDSDTLPLVDGFDCPDDPLKDDPGICGCGIPDEDSDGDGFMDCVDECPGDSLKLIPGVCGCGTPDEDGDEDGILDCLEECPGDPNKTEAGVCGCGVEEVGWDTDMDGDGILDCLDGCQEDSDKIDPGLCGCGVSDEDTDGDGVPDCFDNCAADPEKVEPGQCGCGESETDSDADGTADCNDECTEDPGKTEPGICGCGIADVDTLDGDGDGTPACNDACDEDPDKIVPGVCGCGLADVDTEDRDEDGTPNCLDLCPDDVYKDDPGVCGCFEIDVHDDADLDGTADCVDNCPNDANKTEDGICGCGVSDTDSDDDGAPDCNDNCPEDGAKTEPGICDCGVSDADSDEDGTVDCHDNCAEDGAKIEPGICGCGLSDVDSDGDGTVDCNDNCAEDGAKIEPGICGCGFADTDSDGDGTADCNDNCPSDPLKTEPGACGCDTPDTELRNWYPDCDGDGEHDFSPTYACGTSGADTAFDCEDSADPDGGWSETAGIDCDDEFAQNPCDCGEQDNDGDGNCAPVSALVDAFGAATGLVDFELTTGTLPLYVDGDYDSGGWVLIGRGREGWAWTESGVGDPDTLSVGLGAPAAFVPAYLSTTIVQELIDNSEIDLTRLEIRVKRAAAADGSSYQETLWQSQSNIVWTWLFDSMPYNIDYSVQSSVLGSGGLAAKDTRDIGTNDHRRTFTWAWNGHNYKRGFSYGTTVSGGTTESDNFFWQNGTENHAIPYSEVYIRYRTAGSCLDILTADPSSPDGTYEIDPDGLGGSAPFAVTCDMSDGGWTLIYEEDFEAGDSSGWETGAGSPTAVDTVSTCATVYSRMLGGYGILGGGAETGQTFDLLGIPHTEVSVALDYFVIDSWDGEDAIVNVDGVEQYRGTFNHGSGTVNVCGNQWKEHGPQPVDLQPAHSAGTVTVQVTSTLNSDPTDESFGVDTVVIRIR